MLEKVQNPRLKGEERKRKEIMTKLLSNEEKEFRLVLDEDRTSIEISTGEESIELVPTKHGDLEIYMENHYQTRMLKKEFLNKITKQLEEDFDDQADPKNFAIRVKDNKNILAILLKIKASLESNELGERKN